MPGRTVDLIFRGSNRSVVRSLTEIASASDRTTTRLERNAKKTGTAFGHMGQAAHSTRGAISGLAGTVGLGGLAFGLKSAVQGGMALSAQQAQLQAALRATGQAGHSTAKRLQDSAERSSVAGGFGAVENTQALTQFVTATHNASKAQRDLGLATAISRRSGKDFSTTVRAIMMLENGRTTGLARLGIAIPKVTTAEDKLKQARGQGRDQLLALTAAGYKFTSVQKAQYALHHQITPQMLAQAKAQDALGSKQAAFVSLQGVFGSATKTFANSTAGRISNLQHTWSNLTDQLGQSLLPVINKVVRVVATLVGWLNKHRVVLYGLLGAVGAVTAVLTAHRIAVDVAKASSLAFAGAQKLLALASGEVVAGEGAATLSTVAFGVAMRALPILALIGGLVLLVTHFGDVKRAAGIAWQWIKTAASNTFNWIKAHWPLLAGILLAPFTLGISVIIGLFHGQLLSGVRTVVGVVGNIFHGVLRVVTWPFREAFKVIRGIWKTILGDVRWLITQIKGAFNFVTSLPGKAVHAAGSLLHSATFGLLHSGGLVKPKYMAAGGPVGSDTIPGWLSPGEYVLNRQQTAQAGVHNLDRWRTGGQPAPAANAGNITIQPGTVVVQIGARQVAEAVVRYQLGRAARGPSSLVGGAMSTGARG